MRWGLHQSLGQRATDQSRTTRVKRRDRLFKGVILVLTGLVVWVILTATRVGCDAVASATEKTRLLAMRRFGLEPQRDEIEAIHKVTRARTVERTRESLSNFYKGADPEIKSMFRAACMDPTHGLIGSGRLTDGFVISSGVFGSDPNGRCYRLLPNRKSIWLRQVTIHNGPFGMFLVPDNPEMRAAAAAVHAIVDERSAQSTNSWGLRGPEPDPDALVRGIVLGDSFMLGMFNGDRETPPYRLQLALKELWDKEVSLLNTGHIGYAPEQYYYSLKEYGERFRPHFVVVSVCPNDFGSGGEVLAGRGDDWDEAKYWLGEIVAWCRAHSITCLLVPVPCDIQFLGSRRDGRYPARISDIYTGSPTWYFNALDLFIDEHLRLMRAGERDGKRLSTSPLYNGQISDNHFSPTGARFWAKHVGRRLDLIMRWPKDESPRPKPTTSTIGRAVAPVG